jgi:hypothetical protein
VAGCVTFIGDMKEELTGRVGSGGGASRSKNESSSASPIGASWKNDVPSAWMGASSDDGLLGSRSAWGSGRGEEGASGACRRPPPPWRAGGTRRALRENGTTPGAGACGMGEMLRWTSLLVGAGGSLSALVATGAYSE